MYYTCLLYKMEAPTFFSYFLKSFCTYASMFTGMHTGKSAYIRVRIYMWTLYVASQLFKKFLIDDQRLVFSLKYPFF